MTLVGSFIPFVSRCFCVYTGGFAESYLPCGMAVTPGVPSLPDTKQAISKQYLLYFQSLAGIGLVQQTSHGAYEEPAGGEGSWDLRMHMFNLPTVETWAQEMKWLGKERKECVLNGDVI